MLTVGSLFSGIGGIDLGLERTGHFRTIWFSEIDPYANRVLAKHWPNVPNLGNVKEIDFGRIERPDVLVGGYPCQPFSTAGKRQGENDPRHLWPECLRALRILRPRYALFENVRGHVSLGFPRVLSDLASIGFNAEWQVIPAAAVGAPHKRDRLFIVAYPDDARVGTPASGMERQGATGSEERHDAQHELGRRSANVADTSGGRFQECEPKPETAHDISKSGATMADATGEQLGRYGTQGPVTKTGGQRDNNPGRKVGYVCGQWWEVEPAVGRVANGVPFRVDRLRALGNAVVPQVAEYIGYLIAEHTYA